MGRKAWDLSATDLAPKPPNLRVIQIAVTMEQRKARRVVFERGYAAHMMAIDGTWRRACMIVDVSEAGAQLSVDGPIEGLPLKEFFLLLSSTGLAYRRCALAWVNGDRIGVTFMKAEAKKSAPPRSTH